MYIYREQIKTFQSQNASGNVHEGI